MRERLGAMTAQLTATLVPWPVPNRVFRVEDYGARADGVTVVTAPIQAAIDACSASGGGRVVLAKGAYVSGTIDLKSGVMLQIAAGARLLGSTNLADYPDRVPRRPTVMDTHMKVRQSLVYAEGADRIGIRGPGTIDFRGSKESFPGRETIGETPGRPFGIRIIDSRRVVVEDVTLRNSACWMQSYLNCEDLILQRVRVDNHANWNNDGIDVDGCRRVIVRQCHVNAEDDALCLKGASLRPTEDVLIEDSAFFSTCNALKIGTDTQGDFRRIVARRVTLGGIPEPLPTSRGREASTGITLATVDGGDVEDVLVSGAAIHQARCPIFLRVGNRGRLMPGMPPARVGRLRRVVIEDVTGGRNLRQGSLISGIARGRVEDVVLRRVRLGTEGGGDAALALRVVPENEGGYPDAHKFLRDGLPAFGFWLRHAARVVLEDVHVTPEHPESRPAFGSGGDLEGVSVNGGPVS